MQSKKITPRILLLLSFFSISVQASSDGLSAGFAAFDVTPPTGVPLAGFGGGNRRLLPWDVFNKYPYATFLKPSSGKIDPIRAKVMVLHKGDQRLLFIGLDVVAFTKDNRADLMKLLKYLDFKDNEVFVAATHTHSGPGTLSKNTVWQLLAADKFQSRIYDDFLDGIFHAVTQALTNLKPAELFHAKFLAEGLQKNRRLPDGPVDNDAQMLIVRSKDNGANFGALFNLAIHGTALKTDNLQFSADVSGSMERALEAHLHSQNEQISQTLGATPIAIHLNGAEGDVTPFKSGLDGMDYIGQHFAEQAAVAMEKAIPIPDDWSLATKEVKLASPGLNLKGCVKEKTLRTLIWKSLRLKLGLWFPKKALLYSVKLGPLYMMSWPGEPTTALGLTLKDEARKAGFAEPWVLGLTNDYLAYWTAKDEYNNAAYEACNTLYGEKGGATIIKGHHDLFDKHP